MSTLALARTSLRFTGLGHRPGGPTQRLLGNLADGIFLLGVLFVPLYVPNIGGIFGIVASDILLALAGLARVLHLAVAGFPAEKLRRQSYLFGVLGVFALAGIFAQFVNGQSPILWSYIRLVLATAGSVFMVATFGGDDWKANRLLILRVLGFGFVILGLSVFQGLTLHGRPIGFSLHPNALGHSCVMGVATAVWLFENTKHWLERSFWAGGALACFYALMQSGSRGSLLGLWAAMMIYLVLRGSMKAVVGAIAATWLALILIFSGIVTLPANNPITRFLDGDTGSAQSTEARRELLNEDFKVIAERPLFGVGFEDEERLVNVHVVYFQGWVAAGALAAFCLMLLGVTMLGLPLITKQRDLALTCGAAGIAVAWVVTNILTLRDQWIFLTVAFGSAQSISVLRAKDPALPVPSTEQDQLVPAGRSVR